MNINNVNCTGCGACLNICPYKCINIKTTEEGFLKAIANNEFCIKCGKCLTVCATERENLSQNKPIKMYAGYADDSEIRQVSTSGGIFSCLAAKIIKKGGVVYGAAFTKEGKLEHIRIQSLSEIGRLRGTKYLQSNATKCFDKIKKDLDEGRFVLFSGTPCQVYGLKTFMKGGTDRLYTIDLICHGVPSASFFYDYRKYQEKKFKGEIIEYFFRNKEHPNDEISYTVKLLIKQGEKIKKIYISGDEDPYTLRFIGNALQNTACYECKFANMDRVGDITLGDYWGGKQVHPELSAINGISLILINSQNGNELINSLNNVKLILTSEEKAIEMNAHLCSPSKANEDRDIIYAKYASMGFSKKFYNKYFLPKGYRTYIIKRYIRSKLKK